MNVAAGSVEDLEKRISGLERRVKRQRHVGYMNGIMDGALQMLGPDDVIVDCGANLGEYTRRMAATGAEVYAFEPDPWTFERLERNTKRYPNVTRIQAAVGAEAGSFELYRSPDFENKPRRASISSSIVPNMRGVDENAESTTVEVICFPDWLEDKLKEGKRVKLVKIDIEGAEIDLMNAVMDRGLPHQVGLFLIETHEKQLKSEADRFAAMRARAEEFPAGRVNFDWI